MRVRRYFLNEFSHSVAIRREPYGGPHVDGTEMTGTQVAILTREDSDEAIPNNNLSHHFRRIANEELGSQPLTRKVVIVPNSRQLSRLTQVIIYERPARFMGSISLVNAQLPRHILRAEWPELFSPSTPPRNSLISEQEMASLIESLATRPRTAPERLRERVEELRKAPGPPTMRVSTRGRKRIITLPE